MADDAQSESPIGNLIFLSYRRQDTMAETLALKLELERRLSAVQIFMDYRTIEAGARFADQIEKALRVAKVVLIVIGEGWEGSTKDGGRRIESADDWVHREVSFALQNKQDRLIPILMDRDSMPDAAILPPALRPLTAYQSRQIRMAEFASQVNDLLQTLEEKYKLGLKKTKYKLPVPDITKEKTIPYPWDSLERDILTRLVKWTVEFSDDPDKYNYKRVKLRRDFQFKNFMQAIKFVNTIAQHADTVNHHPRVQIVWKTATVWISTWDAGHRITALDMQTAKVFEKLYKSAEGAAN